MVRVDVRSQNSLAKLLAAVVFGVLISGGYCFGQKPMAADPWHDFRFLMGAWETDSGVANSGAGTFSLIPDIQNHVLVRRNHAEYPAVAGRPASVHDDLMIIYVDPVSGYKAHYYDSDRKSTRLNSSHIQKSRMPSSA